MNRTRLDAGIQSIRDYTEQHPELADAHHFIYDSPLDKSAGTPEFVVMGINPGETKPDWTDDPQPTEITWNHDFNAKKGECKRSRGNKVWRDSARRFTRCGRIVFTEALFWSSHNEEECIQ